MNGSVPSLAVEGRVEVCYDNVYSTVCDDLWDERAAQVVCRDFSMSSGAALSGFASPYGSGNGSILLDNVVCTGTEDNLLHCAHNPLFENNCGPLGGCCSRLWRYAGKKFCHAFLYCTIGNL